jgi:phage-related tail protein
MDIQNKVTAIYNVFFDFMDYIAERFDDILDYIGLRFDEVQEDIQDGFGDIQGDIETGFDEIQDDIQTGFSDIQDEFDALQSQISASIGDTRTIHTTTQTYTFDYTDTLPAEWFITVEGDTNAPFELLALYIDIERI